jgi:hypothetical protein
MAPRLRPVHSLTEPAMIRLLAIAALLLVARPVAAEPPPTFLANYYGPGFDRVCQMALGPDGRVYLADAYNNRLVMLTQTGTNAGTIGGGSGFGLPTGVAFDAAGNLYVAEQSSGRISKFEANTLNPLGTMGTPGTGRAS